jgi:zinc transport system substrate-binding protein
MVKIVNRLIRQRDYFFLGVAIATALLCYSIPTYGQTVVASTSLTAAIATAAGAREVRVLTPLDVKHPPEYELKPSDLLKFEGAQAVVYAGYERMVTRILETSGGKNIVAIRIDTATSPENIILQTKRIASVLHTEKTQAEWETAFHRRLETLKARLAPFTGKRAVVVIHAQPFAQWAGLEVVQVVSPGELSVKALTEAVAKHPDVVVDVLHMPAARIIAENAKSRYTQIINFPGSENTVTIEDVFEFNTSRLVKALN